MMNDECDRRVEVGVTQWALINVIPSGSHSLTPMFARLHSPAVRPAAKL